VGGGIERAKCGNPVGRSPGILESRRFPGQLIDWPATVGRTDGRVERHRWGDAVRAAPRRLSTPLDASRLGEREERVATSTPSPFPPPLSLSLSLSLSVCLCLWQRAPTRKIELLVTTARDTIHENISLNHAAAAREPPLRRSAFSINSRRIFPSKNGKPHRVIFLFSCKSEFRDLFCDLLSVYDALSELKYSFYLEAKIVGRFLLFNNERFNKRALKLMKTLFLHVYPEI